MSETGGGLCHASVSPAADREKNCTRFFICALMTSALLEPGTGARKNGLFLFPYATGNTTKQPPPSDTYSQIALQTFDVF